MRPRALALGILAMSGALWMSHPDGAHATVEVTVTSAADSVLPGESECPHATRCTLRRAIEFVNADASGEPATISFDPAVFDAGADVSVQVLETPLPAITRDDVTLNAIGREVRLDGSSLEEPSDGLVVAGDDGSIRGINVHGFGGVCVALNGVRGSASGTVVGHCTTGIVIAGDGSAVRGNTIGFSPDGDPAAVTVGILVLAGGARVGDAAGGPGAANVVGNASMAVRVGEASGPAFDDIEVAGNIIGKAPSGGGAAPVGTGIEIRTPAQRVRVISNTIANTTGSGVAVAADTGSGSSSGNRISLNRFEAIGGMSIDLQDNGVREPNDPGDVDAGPNDLLNHPLITRAVQSRIQGTACAGCRVEVYLAAHVPGGVEDYGTNPVPGGVLTASDAGTFEWNSPPLMPGQWIMALAIDSLGNTSEFSPSARIGAGVAQCGNVRVETGWNLLGYFGQATLALGNVFPPDGSATSTVSAIYRLIDGSANYQAWFENGAQGRTLNTLESGEAYWMHAGEPTVITGGFSLTVALPVALKAGWNEFVYIGATVDVRDALAGIAGKYTAVYRWENATGVQRWRTFDPDLPAWAQGLQSLETCGAYSIFVTEDVTLAPPQP